MRVDGLPGVRTCVTTVRPGMTVEREHGWPGARVDLLRVSDALSPLMPPGFYYRRFRRSPRLFAAFERALAHVAGQGRLPDADAAAALAGARCERRAVDVLVVGGGVAGMSAALAAAAEGAQVLLVQSGDRLGGRVADDRGPAGIEAGRGGRGPAGPEIVARLTAEIAACERLEALTGAEAVGWYEEGVVAVDRRPDLLLVEPATVVLASGAYDAGLPFPNGDLPGVMTVSAALRLVARYDVLPGSRIVIVTSDDRAYEVAAQLRERGADVLGVADLRPASDIDGRAAGALARSGVPIRTGVEHVEAHGFGRVSALTIHGVQEGVPVRHRSVCDTVCVGAGLRPADDLAYQAAARGSIVLSGPPDLEAGVSRADAPVAERPSPPTDHTGAPAGPWLAGLVAGVCSPEAAIAQAEAAGRAAGAAAGSR
jgi:sarcosine oxidase subunit alpha